MEWKDERWVIDDERKFWTAGGAGCGIDMVVEFVKERFDQKLVEFVLEGLQLGSDKGRFYT